MKRQPQRTCMGCNQKKDKRFSKNCKKQRKRNKC